jgi:RNA polymerase sigma factor (TIGR02999 family)
MNMSPVQGSTERLKPPDGPQEVNDLVAVFYDELRVLAGYLLRRRRGDTLSTVRTTSLVHEAYLRLANQTTTPCTGRRHLLAVATKAMRCVLVDRARRRQAVKRGYGLGHVPLSEDRDPAFAKDVDIVALDEALTRLANVDANKSAIVELRFFGGLTIEETAQILGVSAATIKRDWALAKAWLYREMKKT